MSTQASAVATVDSATTPVTPETPAFDPSNQHTWSGEQRAEWNKSGDVPKSAAKQDSAPADKKAAPDSAPDKTSDKSADTASDSATEKSQKPHLKTKEDTEKRFNELLETNKALQRRLESLERGGKTSETRDAQQASQPATEVYKPLDEKEFFAANAKATYEDFVRAAAKHEAKWEVRQELAADAQRRATAECQKELTTRVEEAKKRYPDFEERIQPAVKAITEDQQIPFAVKAVMNDSPVFVDLMYVLAEPAALKDLVATAKSNPAAAIRKIVLTEQLVQAELAKAQGKDKSGDKAADKTTDTGDGKTRDASGKFTSEKTSDAAAETKVRAPKPPSEVGGRGTTTEDALRTAAAANDFQAFEAEQNRRMRASRS